MAFTGQGHLSSASCLLPFVFVLLLLTEQCVGRSPVNVAAKSKVGQPGRQRATLNRGKYLGNDVTPENLYQAYQEIQQEYQAKAFGSEGWRVLTKTQDGVEIAMLKTASDPRCPYIRISATLPSKVEHSWDFLSLSNWDKTMPKINPFYEGLEIKGMYNMGAVQMTLARKRTKRIFGFGRRDFGLVSVSDVPREDGVWVSGTVSVISPQLPRQRGYIRAFQDSISFYKPIHDQGQERTHLTIICRTDLNDSAEEGKGGWIPMWLYLKTIGKSGSHAIQGLRQLLLHETQQLSVDQESKNVLPLGT